MVITIDTRSLSDEFNLTQRQADNLVSNAVKHVIAVIAKNWESQAMNNLHQTRQQYVKSLIVGEEGRFTGYVMLVGKLPNMIESGCGPFDEKSGLLNSSKVKHTKTGKPYITVPFRVGTPGIIGESEVFSSIMPEEIYSVVRKKDSQLSQLGGKVASGKGLGFNDIPEEYREPTIRPEVVNEKTSEVFETYKRKSSIYLGMMREEKTYENTTQGTYVTFRRVSENSDSNSFIHTGLVARNLATRAIEQTNVPMEVDRATDNYLASIGF